MWSDEHQTWRGEMGFSSHEVREEEKGMFCSVTHGQRVCKSNSGLERWDMLAATLSVVVICRLFLIDLF